MNENCKLKISNLSINFNPAPSKIIHIDLNSCFATIEQQANPLLRGKPIVVAAYASANGCILAPSIEAKRFGIKTGMRVKDAKELYSKLIVLQPDPWKYRNVHIALRKIMASYTDSFVPKSIDEFVLDLSDYVDLNLTTQALMARDLVNRIMNKTALEIKTRIKKEIGEWLTVSVGIAPNRYLAKIAAGLHKPDGLDEINKDNYLDVYSKLDLEDLTGIKRANAFRLSRMDINSVIDFYNASVQNIRSAFNSITGYYWYLRLRGFEIDSAPQARRSYGNSYSLPKPLISEQELSPILCKLTEKTGGRLRKAGYKARGVHLVVSYRNGVYWHKGESLNREIFDSREIFAEMYRLLLKSPRAPVRLLAVSVFNLVKNSSDQLTLFDNLQKRKQVVAAQDDINTRWGEYIVTSARMADTAKFVPDRIAFGNVKELEEFTSQ